MSRDECRQLGCTNPPRAKTEDASGYGAKFCSKRCEIKYDHLKADARDAERADMEANQ